MPLRRAAGGPGTPASCRLLQLPKPVALTAAAAAHCDHSSSVHPAARHPQQPTLTPCQLWPAGRTRRRRPLPAGRRLGAGPGAASATHVWQPQQRHNRRGRRRRRGSWRGGWLHAGKVRAAACQRWQRAIASLPHCCSATSPASHAGRPCGLRLRAVCTSANRGDPCWPALFAACRASSGLQTRRLLGSNYGWMSAEVRDRALPVA